MIKSKFSGRRIANGEIAPTGQNVVKSILSLKPSDLVRIKFGSRWYDAEVAEHWNPKSKKGMYLQLLEFMIRILVKKRISKDGTSRRIN